MICLDWISVKFFFSPPLFFRRRGWHVLIQNLWILENICFEILPKCQEQLTKCAARETKIGPRGYPPVVPKNRSQTKRASPGTFQGKLLGNHFRRHSSSFWSWLLNGINIWVSSLSLSLYMYIYIYIDYLFPNPVIALYFYHIPCNITKTTRALESNYMRPPAVVLSTPRVPK